MIEWGTIVIILSLLLMVFLLWKEWSRRNRDLLWARLIAATLAVVSLYLLAMPPVYSQKTESVANALLLFTEGAVKDSIVKDGFEKMPLYDINKDGLDEMLRKHEGVNTIHVFGYGLEPYQLQKLSGQKLVFHPSVKPDGFSQVQYNNELIQGEVMELQGRFHRRDSVRTIVLLMGFKTVLDSALLDDRNVFSLSYIPAHIGVAAYSLIAIKGTDTLEKQLLPLNVAERQPLRVLFLGSAPGFENRFLKDWLSGKGYQVLSRTRVSKKMYAKDFINEERMLVDAIASSLLDQTDIIVADNGALASLPGAELRSINTAIREKGLGLLICVDGEESARESGIVYRVNRLPGGVQQKLDLALNGGTAFKSLVTEDQYDISLQDGWLPLVQSESGRIFSAVAMEGKGRIVLNAINYSHKWMLSGAAADYDRFWMRLVSMALGTAGEEIWKVAQRWPIVDHHLTVSLETSHEAPIGVIAGQKVYLQGNSQYPGHWQGVFWPRSPGWHSLKKTDGTEQLFFVSDRNAWWALRMHERIERTREYVAMQNDSVADEVRHEKVEEKPVPAILFLLLFMITAGFLWYEQKRMGGK